MHGRGWPRGRARGGGGSGLDGEDQLFNLIVVEALAGVCENEIECNLEFRIPPIKSVEISYTISYAILHMI